MNKLQINDVTECKETLAEMLSNEKMAPDFHKRVMAAFSGLVSLMDYLNMYPQVKQHNLWSAELADAVTNNVLRKEAVYLYNWDKEQHGEYTLCLFVGHESPDDVQEAEFEFYMDEGRIADDLRELKKLGFSFRPEYDDKTLNLEEPAQDYYTTPAPIVEKMLSGTTEESKVLEPARPSIWCVTRKETSSEHIYVEAGSEEEAIETAEGIEAQCWRQNQDYDGEVSAEVETDLNSVHGRIVNRADGSHYNYEKENF